MTTRMRWVLILWVGLSMVACITPQLPCGPNYTCSYELRSTQ